jgi:type II secretory pathway pseudopilin PulG
MSHTRLRQNGHTMLEMLVAMVSATLVLTSALLLFLGGIRVSTKTQASSHALRIGSSGVDRMRLDLSEAVVFILPDKQAENDDDDDGDWSNGRLGSASHYTTQNPNDHRQSLNTAVFVALPTPQDVTLRTGASQTQTVALPSRRRVTRGLLIYRGDSSGKPAADDGTFLWAWRYENGTNVSRTVLYRRLSCQWDAVVFRRDVSQRNLLRYRLVQADKDTYNSERTQFGTSSVENLESSDFAIAMLNYAGGAAPLTALPTNGGNNKP